MDGCENKTTDLFHAMDRVRRAWHSVTPSKALSKSEFGTLLSIQRQSGQTDKAGEAEGVRPVSLSELAGVMHQSVPALSQRIRCLEAQGFVTRVPDPGDRRVCGIVLTEEGDRILRVAHRHFIGILSDALDQLKPETSRQLIDSLTELADALETSVANHASEGKTEV